MNFDKETISKLLDNLDEDTLKLFKEEIDNRLSQENKEQRFIELYNRTQDKLDNLIRYQSDCPYDIWEFFWEKLFGDNGIIHQAYKLVPFNTDIIDSSYQDEVYWIMSNWESAVKTIKEKQETEKYFDEL